MAARRGNSIIRGSGHSFQAGGARPGSILGAASSGKRSGGAVYDLVLLDTIDEEAVIANIRDLYQNGQMYSYIGNVVVSVNPFADLGIYGPGQIERYRGRSAFDPKLPPHIYALADNAFSDMKYRGRDQVVIISGESGAGKTEASKKVMEYIAAVSGQSDACKVVKDKLLNTNPVLEAFGNAKTTRNDNSSRFGKYMDIQFDHEGSPMGGQITTYLLEKARVCRQGAGERNFHVLYQLLASAEGQKRGLGGGAGSYALLRQGGEPTVRGMDDKQQFADVARGLQHVDFAAADAQLIWDALAGILLLGEVEFKPSGSGSGSAVGSMPARLAQLLQTTEAQVEQALTHNTIVAGGRQVSSDLTVEQAEYARDSLCKSMYQRIFEWLVKRINTSIAADKRGVKAVIGVLDIYGFEIFEQNGFEQFCINYCNEKLQQLFIDQTLKTEQDEYQAEGISWTPIDYFNNKVICDLIDVKRTGIVATLEEESIKPGDKSDERWLQTMAQVVGQHGHFQGPGTSPRDVDRSLPRGAFRISHYAGDVVYTVDGFLDKNTDTLYQDLARLMFTSQNAALRECYPEGDERTWKTAKKRPLTAGRIFTNSMAEMIAVLNSKTPSYVRCIKPNEGKRAKAIDPERFQHQVKYLGLVENVRVRRAGYCFRETYDDFLQRYRILSSKTYPTTRLSSREGAVEILSALGIQPSAYQLGKTKVFIKHPKHVFRLEEERDEQLNSVVATIQQAWKAMKARRLIGAYVHGMRHAVAPVGAIGHQNSPKYGYSPGRIQFPQPPAALAKTHALLMPVYASWWAKQMVSTLDEAARALMRLQLRAHRMLMGHKQAFKISAYSWSGNYASEAKEGQKEKFLQGIGASGEEPVFSCDATKVSRKGKPDDRQLVMTGQDVFLAKEWKGTKARRIPISEAELVITTANDTIVVVKGGDTDWLLSLPSRTLADFLARGAARGAAVKVSDEVRYDSGKGEKAIAFSTNPMVSPDASSTRKSEWNKKAKAFLI